MVKISVIVPVYNPPKHFLEDCINSLLQQTLSDIEIILVDNGSTGGCFEVLDSAAKQDSRVVLQRFSENRQFSGAVNSGLALATGKYILIVDSDDYLDCNACRKLYAEMEKHPKTDMLFFCAYEKDEGRKCLHETSVYDLDLLRENFEGRAFTFSEAKGFLLYLPSQAWGKFYKKEFLLDNQNFIDDDLGSACADSLFSFKNYCNAGEMRIISERLYYYRTNVHEGVVGGLGAKSCPYFLNPVLFARKVSELQKKLGRYAEEFTTYNASQLHYFFNLIHKSNRSKYYDAMRVFLANNLDTKKIFDAKLRKWVKNVIKYPYWYFSLKRFLGREF